ncbi:endolytic peptidoglycan transglycosylase RlpA [Morganella morganii]|uniref:endolytic peptidoglycan transglycosylase RlpA n=1 Tax=Morganella morganii TaxID=582 RepID=UPI0004691144|nr:endolytic peptidoglycan transglycosylase RlpA [Morganella morganii]
MRLQWIAVTVMAALLAGCPSVQPPVKQTPPPGPAKEILGAVPAYEPLHPGANNDYVRNGQQYQIVRDPENFSQQGYAWIYGQAQNGNRTATGEIINSAELTASHPTLPIPGYARITNMANNRMMVVRINDRGPYMPGKQIGLSRAVADRLNLLPNTKIKIDPIVVAEDGSLSGTGTVGTVVAKQSYALPGRPELGKTSALGTPVTNTTPVVPISSRPVMAQPQPESALIPTVKQPAAPAETQTENTASPAPQQAAVNGYRVQVGAVASEERASQWQKELSDKLGVPGMTESSGDMFRVQLGPFTSRERAAEVQGRLQQQLNMNSFILAP